MQLLFGCAIQEITECNVPETASHVRVICSPLSPLRWLPAFHFLVRRPVYDITG